MNEGTLRTKATNVSWRTYKNLVLFKYRSGAYEIGKVTDQIAVELKGDLYEIVIVGTNEVRKVLPNWLQVHNYLTKYAEEIGLPKVNFSPVVSNLKPACGNN